MTPPVESLAPAPVMTDPSFCMSGACREEDEKAFINVSETIVLAGNPNVGKSVVFNALTGRYTNVSNFPGTTVDIPRGMLPDRRMLKDTPGVYGLSAYSEEEMVAQKAILSGDKIINVVSALSLERDLFLTQHILDYGKPMLVVLNQMDEAEANGVDIDVVQLQKYLGVPVVPTVATLGKGLDGILPSLAQACVGNALPDCPPPEVLAELEGNPAKRMQLYGLRRQHVNAMVARITTQRAAHGGATLSRRIGQLFLNPFVGALSGLVAMVALYQIVGIWVAGDLVKFTEGYVMLGYVVPFLQGLISQVVPHGSPLYVILAGEFGVLTMSIQYIFGVLFPLILGFYVYISVLEDCGYLPRIAVLCDGMLTRIGLNGRAVIPIILGFGCVTMATVSTRVLASQRERTIASTILAITIPCSAQIAVILGLMGMAGGLKAWLVFMAFLTGVLLLLGTALNKMLPGKSTGLLLDLPPMRLPQPKNIARKTWVRSVVFLKEAAPLFIVGSLLVSVAQVTGFLGIAENWLAPITVKLLHLPAETAKIFIMGMVRRDFGAAGLFFLAKTLTPTQILTALITVALFVPCIASFTVIWKERGIKESTLVLTGSWAIAFAVGAIATRLIEWTHVLG